ncbi:tryptophan synthase subunit alpha [Filibacter tadaridae]|uniref:Tryptophan synthase alpha chain n=1 Tax=Filibacter tadaridae TaxID=2483811 RepID=A0A3P5WDK9_9BACL|nr:tryptophan synthase subunit alpha [Filibacter tadaridae]VDC21633.1 Tryptophan synthase alpha chain [Filibacter tadaridae]
MTEMMLTKAINACIGRGEKAFIPYIMAGDDGLHTLKDNLLFLQEAGVTAIEIGIPFSDPVADGPVIQQAGERALAHGVTLRSVVEELTAIGNEIRIPLIIMTYLNPVLRYGIGEFVEDCRRIGLGGLIIPDLPLEESGLLRSALDGSGIALVPLVSLTSPNERIQKITATGEGFIYAVTVNGITGVRNEFEDNLALHFEHLKAVSPVPVLAGFGISTPEQVRAIGGLADGVIVGSAIVDAFHRQDLAGVKALVNA